MNVCALTFCLLPVLAYADTLALQCPASQLLSNMTLAHSGCVAGDEVFSNVSVTSVELAAGAHLTSMEIESPSSIPGATELEFSGGLTVNGGNSGRTMYEIISYDISTLNGATITDLMLGLGNVDRDETAVGGSADREGTAVGGSISTLGIVTAGTGERDWAWAVPGHAANISFGTPQTSVHVTDIVRLHAAPNSTVTIGGLANRLLVNAEPGTVVLFGTALLLLVKLTRRALPRTLLEDHRQ